MVRKKPFEKSAIVQEDEHRHEMSDINGVRQFLLRWHAITGIAVTLILNIILPSCQGNICQLSPSSWPVGCVVWMG